MFLHLILFLVSLCSDQVSLKSSNEIQVQDSSLMIHKKVYNYKELSPISNEIFPDQIITSFQDYVPEESLSGVVGGTVELPCHTSPPQSARDTRDGVKLVLWFKDDSNRPLYTYDTRSNGDNTARHWSNTSALAGRAFFRGGDTTGVLVIDGVQASDAGMYKCRVDFFKAQTQISRVSLHIIVPPEKPRIYNERDEEQNISLGPYRIGERVVIKCETWGGSPSPQLFWWRDHSLLDSSYETLGAQKVVNVLVLERLERTDLHSIITCQASNNNLSTPVSTSVKIDMHFGPLTVQLVKGRESLSAGKSYEAKCEVIGARPPPRVTWWRGAQQIRENITTHTSPDGNVTLSTITYIPTIQDTGKFLGCRAADQQTGEGSKEDGWKLNVNYVPHSVLGLGSSLNGSNIREGDDVYFECIVRSNPRPYKITWRRNETPLVQNLGLGIIISTQSLVIQRVGKHQSGIYTCVAHNTEGDGVSNPVTLNVRYAPYCKQDQQLVYGVARLEKTTISCEVVSNPGSGISFHWAFNTSTDRISIDQSKVKVDGSISTIEYTPRTELDYGSMVCWGINSIGVQQNPCIFHLIPAGRPDPLHNCSVHSQTLSSMVVTCGYGFDGGLPQLYQLIVRTGNSHALVQNITSSKPYFLIQDLSPGEGYIVTVYSKNNKGRSEPMTLHAFTLRDEPRHIVADPSRQPGNMTMTPVLGILIAIASGIGLVAICIIVVMRLKYTHGYQSASHPDYPETHIQLNKTVLNNPDVIPADKEYAEEEAAFQSFHESKYATIGRTRTDVENDRGRGIRHNLSRLSQEVTYAELTLPRGKGYTQMHRLDDSGVTYASVNCSSPSTLQGCPSPLPEDLRAPLEPSRRTVVWTNPLDQESTV